MTNTKKFAKPFLSVHMGPRSNLLSKNCRKSRDTVPLILFLSYQGPSCPSWTPWPGRVDSWLMRTHSLSALPAERPYSQESIHSGRSSTDKEKTFFIHLLKGTVSRDFGPVFLNSLIIRLKYYRKYSFDLAKIFACQKKTWLRQTPRCHCHRRAKFYFYRVMDTDNSTWFYLILHCLYY